MVQGEFPACRSNSKDFARRNGLSGYSALAIEVSNGSSMIWERELVSQGHSTGFTDGIGGDVNHGMVETERVSTSRLTRYPSYKDSSVEWLGEIPAHWAVKPVRREYDIQLGKMLQPSTNGPHDSEVPYFKAQHVQWEDVRNTGIPFMWANSHDEVQYGVLDGDLLVCEGGEVGRAGIVRNPPHRAIIQNALHRVRSVGKSKVRLLMYQLRHIASQGWFDILCNRATIAHFTSEKFGDLPIPVPPILEQRAIATFLDHETARIDALVAKKERLIELLQEKRSALISHAVTRGLVPNVPVKDSGVEWVGRIPAHWTGLPLKRWVAVKITDGPHETPLFASCGVDFISAEAVSNGTVDFERRRGFISQELHSYYSRKCRPVRDDILICKSGATTGKLARVNTDREFSIWSPLAVVRSNRSLVLPRYLEMALETGYVQDQIKRTWSAGTQPNISMGDLERLHVVAPDIDEQAKIIAYVDAKTGGFSRIIGKVREVIDRLKELRQALISAAVTGKIDVRNSVR